MPAASAQALAQSIEEYLAEHPTAAVLEDGRVLFEMRAARYSVSDQRGRCQLQLWSEERNLIRTVIEIQARALSLRLLTRRMGQSRPQSLQMIPCSDRRPPTVRDAARRNYLRLLERVLTRVWPMARVEGLRSAMDLEHSFGPACARGRLLQGPEAEAVIGVGAEESSATIDGILTLGLLWLDYCRQHGDPRRHVGGLRVIVPAGSERTTAERIGWLNADAARVQLYTLDERSEELSEVDCHDFGNLQSRLVPASSEEAVFARCGEGIARLMTMVPEDMREHVELRANSPAETGLLLHGLEFGRVRLTVAQNSFQREKQVSFGAGVNETPLLSENEALCRELLRRLFHSRHAEGSHTDALFRMQPERWLESRLRRGITEVLPSLAAQPIYSQVPAISAGERGMLDLLGLDRRGRLAVIEIKADEDLHLPLQALDYWIRVRALLEDQKSLSLGGRPLTAFQRQNYFPGAELSAESPRLVLIAPALRIHPANETVLHMLSPQIEWELIALAEDWRRELKVVFRKHSGGDFTLRQ